MHVSADDRGLVSHAGTRLLTDVAAAVGLGSPGLEEASAMRSSDAREANEVRPGVP